MRTNLQSQFRIVKDVRSIPDPWGMGVVFEVRRIDNPAYQEFVQKLQEIDPIYRGMQTALAKGTLRAISKGGDKAIVQAEVNRALEEQAEVIDLDVSRLKTTAATASEGVAKYLLAGWSGLTEIDGSPVPFTPENAAALLASEEWVDESMPFGNQTLGAALRAFLLEEAKNHAAYREAYLDEAGKGSAPPSGGASAAGAN